MSEDYIVVGQCECGNAITQHRQRRGATPKRCTACRKALGASAAKRGPRAAQHENRNRGQQHDGPIVAIRRLVASLPDDQRPGGVTLHVACAAVALTSATGLPEQLGEHIIEAMSVLVEQGESGEDIRRRLNPNPFGRLPASMPRRGGLLDYLEEAETA